jgi:hypothetical protein
MAQLPYISSPGNIDKALAGIRSAAVPDRVSQDFVKTILKIPGGSGDQMTSFLRKLGLSNSDGTPNELYRKFRNPASSGAAIATAIKSAYAALYARNEFTHELSDQDLLGLVVEETGLAHDSQPVRLVVSCIKHLKAFADFNTKATDQEQTLEVRKEHTKIAALPGSENGQRTLGLNLGYTINLNLPATSDPEVFDAIFKSIKEHLLKDQDA